MSDLAQPAPTSHQEIDQAWRELARRVRRFSQQTERLLGMNAFDVSLASRGCLILHFIEVPPSMRGRGLGSSALARLVAFADSKHLRIELRPSHRHRDRLVRFYGRFGFREMAGGYMVRPSRTS